MTSRTSRLAVYAIGLMWLMVAACTPTPPDNDILKRLDDAVEHFPESIKLKEHRIDSLKRCVASATDPRDRFRAEMALKDEFASYSLDSAFTHARRAISIARQLGDSALVTEGRLALGYLCNTSGVMSHEALQIFEQLGPTIPDTLRFSYYCLGLQIYRDMAENTLDADARRNYLAQRTAWRDSALTIDPANQVLLANRYIDEGDYTEALQVMGDVPDGLSDRGAAITYHILAKVYARVGNVDRQRHYLAQAAYCDLTNGVREYLALQQLASILYADGDIDRAHRYIHRSIDDATAANAKRRMLEMSEIIPVIDSAYNDLQQRSRRQALAALGIIGILTALMLVLLVLVRKRNRRLAEANRLQMQLNERLATSDRIKEEYITRFMNLSLDYLAKMESYRLKLNKVAAKRNFDRLAEAINSNTYIADELTDFYNRFDEAFLQLYPTFVDDINGLLRPDAQIVLKPGERLNTELRIFAIMQLGITDSAGIARFLRCSASTIYNYRTRMRSRAIDREAFDAQLAALYA